MWKTFLDHENCLFVPQKYNCNDRGWLKQDRVVERGTVAKIWCRWTIILKMPTLWLHYTEGASWQLEGSMFKYCLSHSFLLMIFQSSCPTLEIITSLKCQGQIFAINNVAAHLRAIALNNSGDFFFKKVLVNKLKFSCEK